MPSYSGHECAVDDCGAVIPRTRLMCRRHWFKVPKPIRDRVTRGWRAYCADGPDEAVADYWQAREDAIEAAS